MVTSQHKAGVVRITVDDAHKAWAAACSCGWTGKERQEFDLAKDDAQDHRISHDD